MRLLSSIKGFFSKILSYLKIEKKQEFTSQPISVIIDNFPLQGTIKKTRKKKETPVNPKIKAAAKPAKNKDKVTPKTSASKKKSKVETPQKKKATKSHKTETKGTKKTKK